MLCERPGRGNSAVGSVAEKGERGGSRAEKRNGPAESARDVRKSYPRELLLACVEGEFLRTDHLSVQCAGNERFALDFASLGISDGDAMDFKGPPDGALVTGLGFDEIGQSAQFIELGKDEVTLRLNDEVYGRCAELILFLLGIKRLLLQFARLAGGFDLGAVLRERDVGIADVEQGEVLQLLQLCFEQTLREDRALIVRLCGTVAKRDLQVQRNGVIGKIVVEDGAHGVLKAGVHCARNGCKSSRSKDGGAVDGDGDTVRIDDRNGAAYNGSCASNRSVAGQPHASILRC